MNKPLTIIETRYAPDAVPNPNSVQAHQGQILQTQLHIIYARLAMADAIKRDEIPFASHLLYTQCLDDTDVFERNLGLVLAEQYYQFAHQVVLYSDLGQSAGMKQGRQIALEQGITIRNRRLFPHISLEKKQELYSEIHKKGLQLPKAWSTY